jgi:hypothetical protein
VAYKDDVPKMCKWPGCTELATAAGTYCKGHRDGGSSTNRKVLASRRGLPKNNK